MTDFKKSTILELDPTIGFTFFYLSTATTNSV